MGASGSHGPTERVIREFGQDAFERLVDLPGADLTSVLLEVMRRRAGVESPASVLRSHARDRFVRPAQVPFADLRRTEDVILESLPDDTEVIPLAPLVPLGTHTSVGSVDPRIVLATVRRTEVAADPTNGLALIAAERRRSLLRTNARSTERVRLAALQRVVRTQRFEGNAAFAHFEIAGFVTAGRVERHDAFERDALAEHLGFLVGSFRAAGARQIRVGITDLTGDSMGEILDSVLSTLGGVEVVNEPDRARGRGYYERCCFQVYADIDGVSEQIADGGLIDWTQQLVASRKERLCISGIGVERLTLAAADRR